MPHNFFWGGVLDYIKVEDYLVEEDEEDNAAAVLIFGCPDICEYMAALKSGF